MPISKESLLRLLDFIEKFYLENVVLKAVLETKGWSAEAIENYLNGAKSDPAMIGRVRAKFASVRAGLHAEAEVEQAIQEFLKAVPAKKDVN